MIYVSKHLETMSLNGKMKCLKNSVCITDVCHVANAITDIVTLTVTEQSRSSSVHVQMHLPLISVLVILRDYN
jgi:hypothetical protein